ncbi:sigma-54-dependent transcriptional regulator [Parasphingorhabdus halotolerans]|uniref:DNA-binding transcriptional regulator NtrC n=1 Tax=Parasphingorhabdus halotolerans TaxID=2725558 RepID=A0A6H2DHS6_9SPHN|nr:sigma-54 dependent transcriptional regulator [Parasphingorhabdus halotolerans]QJB68222.1 sigma-54-dependent Fis family transcriptional regulator [Parasphingorhabdus halotolerans]
MANRILLVEDDVSVSHIIATALKAEGMTVDSCKTILDRDVMMSRGKYDLLITDVGLGEDDGIKTLDTVRAQDPDLPIIIISAQNTLNTAIRASETGAFEYFPKPFDLDELVDGVRQAVRPRKNANTAISIEDESLPLVGRSAAMQDVYRMIARLLRNDLSVLVLGESGTGKELVAEAIHNLGHRKSGPFVAVNMAAIPADLIEAELFGHEKGAFTGAVNSAVGKFEQAQGGTLFLDEIGDMPMHAQTRLLRALQSGEINRVGGSKLVRLDVRIIAATNQDMPALIEAGKFREDLYYRINVVPIDLPPLRERASDIPALTNHFLNQAVEEGLPRKQIDDAGMKALERHPWRGNVRELKNIVYRLVVTARDDYLSQAYISQILNVEKNEEQEQLAQSQFSNLVRSIVVELVNADGEDHSVYVRALEHFERPLLEEVLSIANGNQIKAAKMLGINRNTLRKKLNEYEIDPTRL